MPQPRRPAAEPPPSGSAAATAAATAAALTATPTPPVTLPPAAVAQVTQTILAGLRKFAGTSGSDDIFWLGQQLRKRFPAATPSEIEKLARLEADYGEQFRRKMALRLEVEIPRALSSADPKAAVEAILAREQRYIAQRQKAMLSRSISTMERESLKRTSPAGAFWRLSPFVKEHTIDCIVMAGKFWPWEVLDVINPPRHANCPCSLLGEDEAVGMGLLPPNFKPPPPEQGIALAEELRERFSELREVLHAPHRHSLHPQGAAGELRDLVESIEEERVALNLREAPYEKRFAKGTVKGGEFMPKMGGFAAAVHHDLASAVKALLRTGKGRGRGPKRAHGDLAKHQHAPPVADQPPAPKHDVSKTLHMPGGSGPTAPHGAAPHTNAEPPKNFEEFAGRVDAGANALAAQYGAKRVFTGISVNPDEPDTTALRWWDGTSEIGRDAPGHLQASAQAQASEGSDDKAASGAWLTYTRAAHEVSHGINPTTEADYATPEGYALEEALAEEMGRDIGRNWLKQDGHTDAVAWQEANPDGPKALGAYQFERARLGAVLDEAGIDEPGLRRPLLEAMAFRQTHTARMNLLGGLVAQREGIKPAEARERVRATLVGERDSELGIDATPEQRLPLLTPSTGETAKPSPEKLVAPGGGPDQAQKPGQTPQAAPGGPDTPAPEGKPVKLAKGTGERFYDARHYSDPRRSLLRKMAALPDRNEELKLADGSTVKRGPEGSFRMIRPDGETKLYSTPQRLANAETAAVLTRHGIADDRLGKARAAAGVQDGVQSTDKPLQTGPTPGGHLGALEQGLNSQSAPSDEIGEAGIDMTGIAFGVGIKPEQVTGMSNDSLDWLDAHVLGGNDQAVLNAEWKRRGDSAPAAHRVQRAPAEGASFTADDLATLKGALFEQRDSTGGEAGPLEDRLYEAKPGQLSLTRAEAGELEQALHEYGGVDPGLVDKVISARENAQRAPAEPAYVPPAKGEVAQRVLGDFSDSQAKHTVFVEGVGRVYTPERQKLHTEILDSFLKGKKPPEGKPRVLFTAGAPGSGKSTILKADDVEVPADAVDVNPDLIKEMLPEFKEMSAARDPYSGAGVHEESSQLASELRRRAQEQGLNIVVDGVGNSVTGKFRRKLEEFNNGGYDVEAVIAHLPLEEGRKRVAERAERSGRSVPDTVVQSFYQTVPKRFAEYAEEPWLNVRLYNTDVPRGEPAKLVASKAAGDTELSVDRPADLESFTALGKIGADEREIGDLDRLAGRRGGLLGQAGAAVPGQGAGGETTAGGSGAGEALKGRGLAPQRAPSTEEVEQSLAEKPPAAVRGIPTYDEADAGLGDFKKAGGSNGAQFAKDKDGKLWLVKPYRGDRNRVATELLANAVYRELGIDVPNAGQMETKGAKGNEEPWRAVAYPARDGAIERWKGENQELGEGFAADALLANWDVIGLEQDNVLWDPEGHPVRLDQGGTLAYRAMGSPKPYGPVPTELWTMRSPKGQANGTMQISDQMIKDQARDIADRLPPEKIDALVDSAPFTNEQMREDVRTSLKARVAFMGDVADGKEELPGPLEGGEADAQLAADAVNLGDLFPEEEAALEHLLNGEDIEAHLHSGAPREAASIPVQGSVEALDGLLSQSRAGEDFYAYMPISFEALGADGDALKGKQFKDAGFLEASTDAGAADQGKAVLKLLVPSGTGVFSPSAAGISTEPGAVVFRRGTSVRIAGVRDEGGKIVIDAVVS